MIEARERFSTNTLAKSMQTRTEVQSSLPQALAIGDGGLSELEATAGWIGIDETVSLVLGRGGVRALFNRSVRKNRKTFPWLSTAIERTPDSPGFVALQEALSSQSPYVAAAANAALLREFRLDLANLVGDSVCEALLSNATERAESRRPRISETCGMPFAAHRLPEAAEVNEALVLAALRAADQAEDAMRRLNQLDRSSHRDPLTDTPDRALFLDRLQSAIAIARRRRTRLALLFIDLDEFKSINDALGHLVGDAALRLVAERLTRAVRDSDTVTRYGGDEFLVLLSEVSNAADAKRVGREVVATLAIPAQIDGHTLHLSASLGISIYPEHGDDAETLICRADTDMYRTKRARHRP